MKPRFQTLANRIPTNARYLLTTLAWLSLLPLFPTNAGFKYRFNLEQTWLYDDLVANMDFPIQKTAEELSRERADMEREFSPFYEIDLTVIKDRQKQLTESFNEQLRRNRGQFPDVVKNTEGYQNYGNYALSRLLNKGVLAMDTFLKRKDKDFVINIIRDNTAEKQTLQNLLTPEKAREWLADSLPFSRLKEPEFLLPLLEPLLTPNLSVNEEKTRAIREQELEKISTARGMVKSGELIVPKGGIITQGVYQKLISYRAQYESDYQSSRKYYFALIGYGILSALVLVLFLFYLRYHVGEIYQKLRWLIFLYGWILLYTYLMYGIKASDVLHPYMVPFCVAPIVIKNFHRRELAFVTHVVTILMVGLMTALDFEFVLLQILAGLVVVFSRFDTRYWAHFFRSILYIVAVYVVGYIGISFITENSWSHINWQVFIWLLLNGFLTLLAYPLIPLLGNVFGFVSSITLAELSDLGHPLLKELSLKAPGTLQHSLQVANLAEAAAKTIGANDLLVKVGALYHDVGKTLEPSYFIENQLGVNPHDNLSPIESARTIIKHVTEGGVLAERYKLPQVITQFIWSHHGTTLVAYFYNAFLKNQKAADTPEANQKRALEKAKDPEMDLSPITIADFQYPGPLPHTREEAILMLADSLEATAKSLKAHTNQAIDDLVERIVGDKVAQGQLQNAQLTFGELEKCKTSFKITLKSIHHVRIEYPERDKLL